MKKDRPCPPRTRAQTGLRQSSSVLDASSREPDLPPLRRKGEGPRVFHPSSAHRAKPGFKLRAHRGYHVTALIPVRPNQTLSLPNPKPGRCLILIPELLLGFWPRIPVVSKSPGTLLEALLPWIQTCSWAQALFPLLLKRQRNVRVVCTIVRWPGFESYLHHLLVP